MKKRVPVAMMMMVAAAVGCTQHTPGGPGVATPANPATTTTANRPTYSDAENTFSMSVPTLATRVTQGETKVATISLSRGTNFQEDVTLQFSNLPAGVTFDPASPLIGRGDKETTVRVQAAETAAIGDFTINVIGHPTKGVDATSEMKLVISKK